MLVLRERGRKLLVVDVEKPAASIDLPKGVQWTERYASVENVDVDVRFNRQSLYSGRVYRIDLQQRYRAADICSVTLVFDGETVEKAYHRAVSLAKRFNLPTTLLDKWRTRASAGEIDNVQVIENATIPAVELQVRHTLSFDQSTPAYVSIGLAW